MQKTSKDKTSKSKMLTSEQKKAYLKDRQNCPYCEDNYIQGSAIDAEEGVAVQYMDCGNCGRMWADQYTLTAIREYADA